MRKTHDVVATTGEYKDRETGEMKKRRVTVGAKFVDDQGRESIKLEALPVGGSWSGWLSLYPVRAKEEKRPAQKGDDDVPW